MTIAVVPERAPPRAPLLFALVLLSLATPVVAQQWNSPEALTLVKRATERRLAAHADSGLRGYQALAHGFVFFLVQVGEGLTQPPRLIRADELDVEVYWRAPDLSKQIILGWRDGRFLPTDINYHRDHLGIIANDFGNLIRIGEGDEVRNAVHPLSPGGLTAYDFALNDSISLHGPGQDRTLYEVLVRPRSYQQPLVVGQLYLDVETAALVRFRFSFTPPAYLDPQLEDITVLLENSLVDGRYWLPWRQEIEIRRRTSWLDFPARTIIRGRWEIGDYDLDSRQPISFFSGPPIDGLLQPSDSGHTWSQPFDEAIAGAAPPAARQDLETVRMEVEHIAASHTLDGLRSRRLAARSVSDVIRVNRVQGLTLGAGIVVGHRTGEFRPDIAIGTSDHRITGGLSLSLGGGRTRFTALAARRVRDVSDYPIIAPALNSILAQEAGKDYGDYFLLESAGASIRHRLSTRTAITVSADAEAASSLSVTAHPAGGAYRPNPALGSGTYGIARLGLELSGRGLDRNHDLQGFLALEAGDGPTRFARLTAEASALVPLGPGEFATRAYLGLGSDGLPAYRSFVLGGRGTLVGEPFRAYGGRQSVLLHAEWRIEAPFPAIPLGSFASTGHTMVLAPFVAAGWSRGAIPTTPWRETDGIRPVVGLAAEFFLRLIRVEAGIGLRNSEFGLTIDVHRDWWGIL